jgi:hypothetical protein
MAAAISNLAGDNLSYTTAGTAAVLDAGSNALLSGITVADLKGGRIKVHFDSGGASTDTLSLAYGTSFATGTVTLFMGQLYVNALGTGAYSVGTVAGGTAGTDLTITFNNTNNVTLAAAQVLLRSLSFKTTATGTPERSISVTVIDRNTVAGTAAVVTVNSVTSAPTDITLSASQVAENTSTTSALDIGTLASVDANNADTHSYSVVGGADQAVFQVSNGTLQFKAGTVLDYETQHSYTVSVRSTDSASLTYDKTLTVTLTDVNDAPVLAVNAGASLTAGTTTTITQALLQATDADNTAAQLTYILQAAPGRGTLALNGTALAANDTFTQADIDGGLLTYQGTQAGADSVDFIVADGAGQQVGPSSFSIAVAAVPPPPDPGPEPVGVGVVLMTPQAGGDLQGTPYSDTLTGLDGRDHFRPGTGEDLVDGGADIDTVMFGANHASYQVVRGDSGIRVQGIGTTSTLVNVERLAFSDRKIAFDMHAGITAIVLGATFGAGAVQDTAYAGLGIGLLDGGVGYAALVQMAINARLGGAATHEVVVNLLYSNVVGQAPGPVELAYYTGLLYSGQHTQATLGMYAAETVANQVNIDLAGLALSGLQYA